MLPNVFTEKYQNTFLSRNKKGQPSKINKSKQTNKKSVYKQLPCTNCTLLYNEFFMVKSIYIFVCLTISPIGCD